MQTLEPGVTAITQHNLDIALFADCPTVNIKQHEHYLKFVASHSRGTLSDGAALEFGVHRGVTISWLCEVFADQQVYGFDSFEGLPEAWFLTAAERDSAAGAKHPKGHFAIDPPDVPENATLVRGFFADSLPRWLAENPLERVRFVHIDSDLYSSASTVLTHLDEYIVPGTVIAFDELHPWGSLEYDLWEEGEWRALKEWLETYDRAFRVVARTNHVQCAIEIVA